VIELWEALLWDCLEDCLKDPDARSVEPESVSWMTVIRSPSIISSTESTFIKVENCALYRCK